MKIGKRMIKENKEAKIASMVRHFFHECSENKNNKYIKLFQEKESATNVALMVTHKIFTGYNISRNSRYINLFVFKNKVGETNATVALMVTHQSNKLGPHRFLGSIPGGGGSPAFENSDVNVNKINCEVVG